MVNTNIDSFWNWFMQNSSSFNEKQPSWRKELSQHLKQIHPDLTFLIGRLQNHSKKDFIVSASGIKEAFPFVLDVVNAAPDIKEWKVIAFKPKMGIKNIVKYDGLEVDPKYLFFDYRLSEGLVNITLFIQELDPSDKRYVGAGFIILESIIGEYNVATKIGTINFDRLPDNHDDLIELKELDSIISDS